MSTSIVTLFFFFNRFDDRIEREEKKWKEEEKKWRRHFTRETRRGESTGVEQRGERETKEDGGGAEASVSSRFTHLTGAKSAKTRGACYRARLNEFGPSVNTRKEKRKRERERERIRKVRMESAAIYFHRLFVG